MSSVKDYFFEVGQERCLVWIKETYGIDIDPDEPSEEWDGLASEYQAMLDAESEEAEARWLERHSYNEFFFEFSEEIMTTSSLQPPASGRRFRSGSDALQARLRPGSHSAGDTDQLGRPKARGKRPEADAQAGSQARKPAQEDDHTQGDRRAAQGC